MQLKNIRTFGGSPDHLRVLQISFSSPDFDVFLEQSTPAMPRTTLQLAEAP